MDTRSSSRRSARTRQSVNYRESPNNTSLVSKSASKKVKDDVREKTPQSHKKRSASDEEEHFSPKKLRNNRTPSSKALESIVTECSPSIEKIDSSSGRRSTRKKSHFVNKNDVKKSSTKKCENPEESIETIEIFDESLNESNDKENKLKPTTLFDAEEDVEGRRLYSFKTPKKREGMTQLANLTPKTPRHHDPNATTPRTPKHQRLSEIQKTPTSRPSASKCTKTPRHVRVEIKKKLDKVKFHEINSDDDFSADESDYNPNESSSSSSSCESSDEEEPVVPIRKRTQSLASRILKTPSASASASATNSSGAILRRSSRVRNDTQYHFECDNYFSTRLAKAKTSDNTLDRLKNPRLPHDELMRLLKSMKASKEHETSIKELNQDYKLNFEKWMVLFDNGFTVLLHGLGSKRSIMQSFHKKCLAYENVIVVNGFFPSLTIKEILDSIVNDILEVSGLGSSPHEIVNGIESEMKSQKKLHIFLIIHNIDGTMLRNDKAQSVLSRLAAIKNIHLIASIDHINAPLLWNNSKLNNYNFFWFDIATFLPYTDETAFENSLMINSSGTLELSSLRSVFQSLTNNARGIYLLLVKYQLKNGALSNYQGMAFKDLYTSCREAFLVSSDIALRAQLTEFFDHKLAKTKRSVDGAENISLPIKNSLLEKFLNEQNN